MGVLDLSAQKLAGRCQVSVEPNRLFMFPHPLAWGFVGAVLILNIFFLIANGFTIEAGSLWPVLSLAVISFFLALCIQHQYPKIAMIAFTFAFFVIAGKAMRVLNYVTTSLAKPFVTTNMDGVDKWMGFDWFQYLTWVNESPILVEIFPKAYDTLSTSTVFTIYILIVLRQHKKLREFLILFFGLAFATTSIGWFFPIQDTFSYYNPPFDMRSNIRELAGVFHLPHFIPLRDGSMKYIDLSNMIGMVQFPSFHTIAGLLVIWAARGSWMIIPMAVVNLTMIASAIVYGGHYLVDIIASTLMVILGVSFYHTFKSTGWAWQVWRKHVSGKKLLTAYQPE